MCLKDKLRAMRVYNTYDLLMRFGDKNDVAVSYRPNGGRSVRPPWAQVWSPRFKTDPDSAWYEGGKKTFGGIRSESVPRAREWAETHYGIKEWAPDPTSRGSYVPKHVADRAKNAAKEMAGDRPGDTE